VISAKLTSGSLSGTYFFEYGLNADLTDAVATPSQPSHTGAYRYSVNAPISDLVPKATYYFRAVVSNSAGTTRSDTGSFSLNAPSLETLMPSRISDNSATLRASVNPHGFATTVEFFLDGVSKGSVTTGTETSPIVVALPVIGLFQGVPSSFTASTRAQSSEGAVDGNSIGFTTLGYSPPRTRDISASKYFGKWSDTARPGGSIGIFFDRQLSAERQYRWLGKRGPECG
jgi:hypothetical protein